MALIVDVPLNTMLADLDETLRTLLRRELERHGFDGVEGAFDAPSRGWSGPLSPPAGGVVAPPPPPEVNSFPLRPGGPQGPREGRGDHAAGRQGGGWRAPADD